MFASTLSVTRLSPHCTCRHGSNLASQVVTPLKVYSVDSKKTSTSLQQNRSPGEEPTYVTSNKSESTSLGFTGPSALLKIIVCSRPARGLHISISRVKTNILRLHISLDGEAAA